MFEQPKQLMHGMSWALVNDVLLIADAR